MSKKFNETVCLRQKKRQKWIQEIRGERLQGIAEGTSSAPRLASSSDVSLPGRNECPSSASAALHPHPSLQTPYPPSVHSVSSPSAHSPLPIALGCHPATSPPTDSLRVLQWNAGGLQTRSTELLHFLLSHPVDLICIQESNLNSSSSFQIPGFSVL